MSHITLSDKHGVNPGLMVCWFCGEASGVALHGRMLNDAAAPHEAIYDMEPCSKCAEIMKQAIFFVEIKDDSCQAQIEADRKAWQEQAEALKYRAGSQRIPPFIIDPKYRTGRLWGIKDTSNLVQSITEPHKTQILKRRWTLVSEQTARQLGLPHDDDPPADAAKEA